MRVLFPDEITNHFEIIKIKEHKDSVEIILEELKELVPAEMGKEKPIILDGYCNPVEIQTFALKGKPTYIKLYRRRWKYQGETEHYSNTYQLHPEGVKATSDFGAFLKGTLGYTPEQYNNLIGGSMRCIK